MEQIDIDDLHLQHEKLAGTLTIKWTGKSRDIDPSEKLIPVINELLSPDIKELLLDFGDLEYINSSSVVPIINFLKTADDKNIKTTVYYNAEVSWQKAMFKAVSNLVKIIKNLVVKETGT